MILSLQYLRGVAAMMVVAFHTGEQLGRLTGHAMPFPFAAGVSGVDVFFVISGFIICRTTAGKAPDPLAFLWKRILRVVPLYWLLTLLVANIAILRPELLSSTVYDGTHLLASLLFVPMSHPTVSGTVPILIPGWTLNYEMAFYLVFALSLLLPKRAQVPTVLLVLVVAVALREFIPYHVVSAFYTMPLILEFGAGIVIAKAYGSGLPVRPRLAALVFAVGCVALFAMAGSGLWRSLASGIPAALIVAGAVFWEKGRGLRRHRLALLVGDASYSIYLTHVLVLPVAGKAWAASALPATPLTGAVFVGACLALTAIVGIVFHLVVERPLLLALGGRRGTVPRTGTPAAASIRAPSSAGILLTRSSPHAPG